MLSTAAASDRYWWGGADVEGGILKSVGNGDQLLAASLRIKQKVQVPLSASSECSNITGGNGTQLHDACSAPWHRIGTGGGGADVEGGILMSVGNGDQLLATSLRIQSWHSDSTVSRSQARMLTLWLLALAACSAPDLEH